MTGVRHPNHRHLAAVHSFSRSAAGYDEHSHVQRESAALLARLLPPEAAMPRRGEILELGCGTGFLSRHLVGLAKGRALTISDASLEMLAICRRSLEPEWARIGISPSSLKFMQLDAATLSNDSEFSLIVSSFLIQWMDDLPDVLRRHVNALVDGGQILLAFPVEGSFRQWREACEATRLPFTANKLPAADDVQQILQEAGLKTAARTRQLSIRMPSSLQFFRSLKRSGAGCSINGGSCSSSEMFKLCRYIDQNSSDGVEITYDVAFVSAVKESHSSEKVFEFVNTTEFSYAHHQ